MAKLTRVFRSETFRFFKELGHNNRKAWMDENRERYQATVVEQKTRRLIKRRCT